MHATWHDFTVSDVRTSINLSFKDLANASLGMESQRERAEHFSIFIKYGVSPFCQFKRSKLALPSLHLVFVTMQSIRFRRRILSDN